MNTERESMRKCGQKVGEGRKIRDNLSFIRRDKGEKKIQANGKRAKQNSQIMDNFHESSK